VFVFNWSLFLNAIPRQVNLSAIVQFPKKPSVTAPKYVKLHFIPSPSASQADFPLLAAHAPKRRGAAKPRSHNKQKNS
jgi:hypothetical protein